MKTNILKGTVVVLLLAACTNNHESNNSEDDSVTSDTIESFEPLHDSALRSSDVSVNNTGAIWSINYDSSNGNFYLHKNMQVNATTLTVQNLINIINATWQPVKLQYQSLNGDTIVVELKDDKALTENMGSEGSEQYLASVTYTLTELKTIQFVRFVFPPGNHAQPGVYSRKDFTDYVKDNK